MVPLIAEAVQISDLVAPLFEEMGKHLPYGVAHKPA